MTLDNYEVRFVTKGGEKFIGTTPHDRGSERCRKRINVDSEP